MAHSKTVQFYRNNTVIRPDAQNEKTAFTVAKETFDSIDNVSDGEAVFVRYKEGDNDPIKTLVGIYHLSGNTGSWTLIQDLLIDDDNIKTLGSETLLGSGNVTPFIPYAQVDGTSTSTVYTATVPGITELKDGVCCLLKNGVVTSAEGFTININNLGAKPSYSNMATGNAVTPTAPTRDTTIFNINYVMLFIYNSTIVEGGAWICYRGYDANTNTIGYQLRGNSHTLPTTAKFYRYRLLFTSADGTHFVPANTSNSTNATSSRTVNQTPIDPFGEIVYYGSTTSVNAESNPSASVLWTQNVLTVGYSFNRTGAALVLPYPKPFYVKCAPQANGSAIIDSTTPYVTELPNTNDGKIYIFLGDTYSATQIELVNNHPVYYHDGTGIRLWTGKEIPNQSDIDAAKPFIVTVTETTSGNNTTYSANKTFAEITAAITDGREIRAFKDGQCYNLSYYDSQIVEFDYIDSETLFCQQIEINPSNSVVVFTRDLQAFLTFDNVPTANSNNPVKSGGVYTALQGKRDAGYVELAFSYNWSTHAIVIEDENQDTVTEDEFRALCNDPTKNIYLRVSERRTDGTTTHFMCYERTGEQDDWKFYGYNVDSFALASIDIGVESDSLYVDEIVYQDRDVFVVNITSTTSGDVTTYSANKTNLQIYNAWLSGKYVIANLQNEFIFPIVTEPTMTYACFAGVVYDELNAMVRYCISTSNNIQTVQFERKDFQDWLESGTNIKTINNQSLLGSGNLSANDLGAATMSDVNTAIAGLVDSAPSTLDTLNELAAALGNDPNFATTVTNQIASQQVYVGSVAGKLYRNNVGGSGNFSISGNSGCIPNLTPGTFIVAIYAKSATQNYTYRFNFGSTTYDLTTTNGIINDVRTVTIESAATFAGSVVNSSVASGSILYVVMYDYQTPIRTVGIAAVTNRYADLDGTPTIPDISGKADKALVGTLTAQYDANEELTGYTCNKTYSQLTTAFDNGTHVLLHEGNEYNCYLYVHEKTANAITFYSQTTTDMEQLKITITSTNTVTYEQSPVVWNCGDY